jgi:myo-inositol-1-phosphate synthase
MRPVDVVAYLEKLPSTAWPYGLVVAVQENGVRVAGDDVPISRNREELVRLLQEEGIRVELWPSG